MLERRLKGAPGVGVSQTNVHQFTVLVDIRLKGLPGVGVSQTQHSGKITGISLTHCQYRYSIQTVVAQLVLQLFQSDSLPVQVQHSNSR